MAGREAIFCLLLLGLFSCSDGISDGSESFYKESSGTDEAAVFTITRLTKAAEETGAVCLDGVSFPSLVIPASCAADGVDDARTHLLG